MDEVLNILPEPIQQVVNEQLNNVCQISHSEHLAIIFVTQLIVAFVFGIINYFGFTKNPNVKSNTLFELFINILKSIMASIFKRR